MAGIFLAASPAVDLEKAARSSLERPFKKQIRMLLDRYRCVPAVEPVRHVLQKVEDVKVTVDSNLKKLLDSQARLQDLESKTETLAKSALEFSRNAAETKKATYKPNVLFILALGIAFILLSLCVIFILSDFFSEHTVSVDATRSQAFPEKPRLKSQKAMGK